MIWLEPWAAIADLDWDEGKKADYCAGWEGQLAREVGPMHILHTRAAKLIARRFDTDDALFQLETGEVAEVHLTWSRGQEPDPRWPGAAIFPTLEHWASESMATQHQECAEEQ
jgi:hypothetical protein